MFEPQNFDPLLLISFLFRAMLGDSAQIPASKMSGQSFKGPPVAAWDGIILGSIEQRPGLQR
jgi:hypothetical protein